MTEKKISKAVQAIPPSGIRKFFDLVSTMDDVISLGVGEPDFITPWVIRESAIYGLEEGRTSYTSNRGMLKLRREICRYLKERYGLDYDPATEIIVTVGASQAIDLAMRAIVDPGDEIIIPIPCYVSYQPMVIMAGGVPVNCPMPAEKQFKFDFDLLKRKITPKTKGLLINYPNNPTGMTFSKSDLEQLRDICVENDLVVVSDEIYADIVYKEKHTSLSGLPGMKDKTILISGFSKAFAMTGWRLGYIAADAEYIEAITKIHQYAMLCAPIMSQLAAIEALTDGREQMEKMVESYKQRKNFITKSFRSIGLPCNEPEGAFYLFPSVKETGLTAEEFSEKLLMEQRVVVIPGTAFGECAEGYVRCSFATGFDDIEEAVGRIDKFLKTL